MLCSFLFIGDTQRFIYLKHAEVVFRVLAHVCWVCRTNKWSDKIKLHMIDFFFFMQIFYIIVVFLQCRLRTTYCPNQNIQFGVIREMNHILQLKIWCMFLFAGLLPVFPERRSFTESQQWQVRSTEINKWWYSKHNFVIYTQ